MDYLPLLQQLNACHAPSGNERDLARLLRDLAEPYADDCRIDTMGNLIVHKKGEGSRLLFAAHMDSIGLIVTHIEKNGYLRLGKLGGVQLHSMLHTPFRFQNGTMGVLVLSEKVKPSDMSLQDLYLDIGAADRSEAEVHVQVGDTAVWAMPTFAMGTRLASPYLDNRISCLILLETLRRIDKPENDLYFVFTVQEELGLRGAQTATYAIEPDYAIAVDVTDADEPDSKHSSSTRLGDGAAIKIMDQSVICHPKVVERLAQLAKDLSIPVQRDILSVGSTDAGAMQRSRAGVLTGGISVPCRYVHSGVETAEQSDVESCVRLLRAFANASL